MKILIVVDMQNDFVTGTLGSAEACAIVPAIKEKIEQYEDTDNLIFFTRDTHFDDYMNTLEGQKLPVPHCIMNTEGWEIIDELSLHSHFCINKETFGFDNWDTIFFEEGVTDIEEIELCGVCTDICVISNALAIRMLFPNTKITVDAKCCAGVTPEKHDAALEVMKSCQIDVIE